MALRLLGGAGGSLLIWLTGVFVSQAGAQPQPRNILLLTSYQNDAFTFHNDAFRTELRRIVPEPLNFLELLIRPAASGQVPEEEPLISYLKSTAGGQRLDLVVAVGGPAAVFVRTHQERLFPTTPILESSYDVRWLRDHTLSRNETAVPLSIDSRECSSMSWPYFLPPDASSSSWGVRPSRSSGGVSPVA